MSNQDKYDKIEAYLQGKLSPTELESFKAEIASNEELIKEISLHQNLTTLLFDHHIEDLRKKMVKINKYNRYYLNFNVKSFSIAAGILVVIICTLWVLLNRPKSPEKLFQAYFKPPENLTTWPYRMTRNSLDSLTTLDSIWQVIETAYQEGRYQEINIIIQSVPDNVLSSAEKEFNFIKGLTALLTNHPLYAIENFNNLAFQSSKEMWFIALAYLKLNQIDKALLTLDTLAKTENDYSGRALKLIKDLKQ